MPQFLSVGTVIDRAWSHYTKHFVALMGISSWLLIIAILNIVSSWLSPDSLLLAQQNSAPLSVSQIIGLVLYGLTFFVLAPILSIWISNQLIKAIDGQLGGQVMSSKALGRFGWKYFFPRLLVGILTGLAILAPLLAVLPGAGVSVLAGLTNSVGLSVLASALIFVGVVAAGLGCVFMAVRLVFTPFSLLLDDHHGRAAIKVSTGLSRGRFWQVCAQVVIPSVVFYIGLTTVQIILLYAMKTIILSTVGLNAALASQLFNMGRSTLFIVLNAMIAPLIVSITCIVYRDLKNNR